MRLPDRDPVVPGLRALWFLVRQWFVAVPAFLATVAWCVFALSLAEANGTGSLQGLITLVALAPVIGFGAAVLTGLPGFLLVRLLQRPPAPPSLEAGEEELFAAPANHFLGDEGRGGRLRITTRRILFAPHRLNVQRAPVAISLSEVRSVGWAVVLGPGRTPLSRVVEVVAARSTTELFLVDAAERVAGIIEQHMSSPSS